MARSKRRCGKCAYLTDASGLHVYRLATVSEDGVSWVLRRNCSLTPRQLGGLFAMLCTLSLAVSGFFWLQGAWMVLTFSAVELLAVGVAFLMYARHATDGETIRVSQGRLVVEREDAGRLLRTEFSGRSLQVDVSADRRCLVELRGGSQALLVGHHLRPELRPVLARELRHALGRGEWGLGIP
jgi:uncharacterized membrane protein